MKVNEIIAECLAGDVTRMEDLCVWINSIDDKDIKLEHTKAVLTEIRALDTSGPSLYCLGMMYEFGLISETIDNETTSSELSAEEAVAATKLKEEQRLIDARTLYIEATEDHEHIPSMIRFANMLARGEGGEQNVDRAIKFYRNVLTKGSEVEQAIANEQIELLTPYTTANISKLFSGVLAGNPEAAATLAHRTKTLVGRNKLSQLGRNLSMKLQDNVDTTEAGVFKFAKTLLLEQSLYGEDFDDQHIVEAYRTAIDLNDANAMNRMAKIYLTGEYGIDQNEDAAIELLQRAADADENPIAAREASQMLVDLFRVKGEIRDQTIYLKKLCNLGDAEAMFELAGLYAKELSITNLEIPNREDRLHTMVELFLAAGSRSLHQAYFDLAEVYKSGLPGFQASLGKAIYYYHKAAGLGNNDALAIDFDDLKSVYRQQKQVEAIEKGVESEDTIISADIETLLIVEKRRKADTKLNDLFLSIDALKTHGDLFPTDSKGKLLALLAKQLESKLTSFILDLADDNTPADKKDMKALDQFKKEFKAIIVENSNELQDHRAQWKPVLANILIALTGVGLVALLGRAVIVALFSEKKNANTFNKYAFFGETASEALSRNVEKSLDAEVEVLRKAPAAAK